MDKPLRDLMEIIHFTEDVSAKIHGVLDEAEIYRIVREEFARSNRYDATILLLKGNGLKLRVVETSLPPEELRTEERATKLRLSGCEIDLNGSSLCQRLIGEGRTIQVDIGDLMGELFPRPLAGLVSQAMSSGQNTVILTPLRRHEKIIGILALSLPDPAEYAVPSVRNLARHLSAALELADEYAERRRVEKTLARRTEELARANAELQQFAYVASHDLQEPLRMISSYMQLLERRYKDKLDADAHDFIAFAVDGANRLQQLINDLLTYSRVETRGKPPALTDCEEVLAQTLTHLQVAIQEANATISHDPLPQVMGDATQLVQLFQNLIGNAIKFRSEAPPRIHVGVERGENEWVFSVSDNGIGIKPQYTERIFGIFQRLHTRAEYPGSGIGLALCRKIVERHGGRIWVESKPGEGSTFYFTIPMNASA